VQLVTKRAVSPGVLVRLGPFAVGHCHWRGGAAGSTQLADTPFDITSPQQVRRLRLSLSNDAASMLTPPNRDLCIACPFGGAPVLVNLVTRSVQAIPMPTMNNVSAPSSPSRVPSPLPTAMNVEHGGGSSEAPSPAASASPAASDVDSSTESELALTSPVRSSSKTSLVCRHMREGERVESQYSFDPSRLLTAVNLDHRQHHLRSCTGRPCNRIPATQAARHVRVSVAVER